MFLATAMFLATYYEHHAKDMRENAGVSLPSFFLHIALLVLPCLCSERNRHNLRAGFLIASGKPNKNF